MAQNADTTELQPRKATIGLGKGLAYRTPGDGENAAWVYTSCGLNVQAGYLIARKWEVALRNSTLFPRSEIRERAGYGRRNQTTLGVSRYIRGQALKVQANVSYNHRKQAVASDYTRWQMALQLQLEI